MQKQEESADVLKAMEGLKEAGVAAKWGKAMDACGSRRSVAMGELKLVGVKDPGMIAMASTRNELAFLVTTVGVTSVLAVAAGALLPGVHVCHCTMCGLCRLLVQHMDGLCCTAPCHLCIRAGDWGFFSAYLIGGISIGVLAIGVARLIPPHVCTV